MAERQDFYDVLGVARNATADEIQRAYRKLARTYHPDVNKDPAAEERFKDVSEAYDVLSDPDTRKKYDAFGHDFRQVPDGVDPDTWARARGGSRSGDGTGGQAFRWSSTGSDMDIDDLFGSFFGGRTRRGWGSVPGADQEAELVLSVEEAYRGGRRSISLSGPNGSRSYDVTIPAGVTDGQRIRLAGQGGSGSDGAPPGDLYLVVRIAPDARYRLDGRDIVVDLPLAPWEAALGASVAVETPDGEGKVMVPPGSSTGRRLRLRGRGMPNPGGISGDLYAEVKVMVPRTLSADEQRLFEELAPYVDLRPKEEPMSATLSRPLLLDLDSFARALSVHPDWVRRLIVLGLLEARQDAAGELWFPPTQLAAAARIQRLRAGFGLNYAALGLVIDLLDRIAVLERAVRGPRQAGG